VVEGVRTITYGELDRRSNQLSHLLLEIGVQPGDRVGLYAEKSIESVIAIYGILKSGAAYVPLDPDAPPARLGFIAGNCSLRCMVTGEEKAAKWPLLLEAGAPLETLVVTNGDGRYTEANGRLTDVSVLGASSSDVQPEAAPGASVISADLAYILYTSGSTGDPKGVMLSHLNALAFVTWAAGEFSVGGNDRLSSHAPLHFDLSVFDLFAAAHAGAAVVLVPGRASMFPVEVVRFIEDNEITIWYSVPSILTMLVLRGGLQPGGLKSLRTVLFAGEVFPTKYLRRLMSLVPHARFANLYGPTETNVCTWYEVPELPEELEQPIPIGRSIADVEVFALADDGRLVGRGETGELHVRGATVMAGYWGDRDRTSRLLVPNPLRPEVGDRVYRTGDLVQKLDDGNYRFLGRRDAQIKSRGHRIELGDIEAALHSHAGVLECAVVAIPHELVTNRIKAYVVTHDVGENELIRFCASRLPRYMVPDSFELMEALPKTSTGKIDRNTLSRVASGSEVTST
jgi:amino acid adenylation domain-containing protein